jgi:predicted DsbA family dithiol-disulfide isomerase
MIVEVFQDTVCPFCRIGKRHLEQAAQGWQGEPLEITYRAFFLNPTVPPEGVDFREFMLAKGGGQVPLEGFFAGPRQMGALSGLKFNFEEIAKAPNSLLSHCLFYIAPESSREQILEDIYTSYFELGRDIGDIEVLLDIAVRNGMDRQDARARLEAGEGCKQALEDTERAQRLGIRGVPFFLIDGKFAFSGAQPPQVILDVLGQVADASSQIG